MWLFSAHAHISIQKTLFLFANPNSNRSNRVPTSPLEQQLLATVTNAERLGPGIPVLSSLYSLATYYQDRKEYDKAAIQFERALQLKEEANGPNHPDVAAILRRYADCCKKPNDRLKQPVFSRELTLSQPSPPPRPLVSNLQPGEKFLLLSIFGPVTLEKLTYLPSFLMFLDRMCSFLRIFPQLILA